MRVFITKLFIYLGLIAVFLGLYLLLIYNRPDLVDDFYYRFTTPKAHSLILGGSLAGQGIHPDIINTQLDLGENHIINHAFAVGPSSYGPNYLKEITKKLKKGSADGLFIISVSPWTLGKDNENDDSTQFFEVERKLFVGNLKSSSLNPNLEYLIHHWNNKFEPFVRLYKYFTNYQGIAILHSNGWLEVIAKMDSISNNERIKRSLESSKYNTFSLSNTRLLYLDKIISYVDKFGEVIIIRMPVTRQMADLEKTKYPEFDTIIQGIADKNNVHYFNFMGLSGQFLTVDAYHLYKKDGEKFTNLLCDSINKYLNSVNQHDILVQNIE